MATIAQSYILTGTTRFFFPFPVRFEGHIQLSVEGAGTVDPENFSVEGAGPAAVSVTVVWPDAPANLGLLTISRIVPVQRVSDFTDDQAITAAKLNAEFTNIYQILEQMQ